jgi:hypothetical protein
MHDDYPSVAKPCTSELFEVAGTMPHMGTLSRPENHEKPGTLPGFFPSIPTSDPFSWGFPKRTSGDATPDSGFGP